MERGAAAFPAFLARRCLCPGGGGRSLPSPSWPFLPCSKLRRSLGPQRLPGLRRPRQEPAQACGVLGSGTQLNSSRTRSRLGSPIRRLLRTAGQTLSSFASASSLETPPGSCPDTSNHFLLDLSDWNRFLLK